jgi:hypothetical protein
MSKNSTIQFILNHFPNLSKNELLKIDELLEDNPKGFEDVMEYLNSFEYKVKDSVVDSLYDRLSKENVL